MKYPLISALLLYLLIPILVLTSCPDGSASSAAKSEDQAELIIRMAVQYDPGQTEGEAARMVRKELERRSNGAIKVRYYESGVLGAERELLEQCYLGMIDMVQVTSSVLTTIQPLFNTLDMPYLLLSEEHQQKVLHGGIGRELLDSLRGVGFEGLAFYTFGFRNMFTSIRPIYHPSDMDGLKIRVMESPVMISALNAMGASAIPLNAEEVYSALKTGVVDGAENNPVTFLRDHLVDACNYYSFTRHFANQAVILANREWLDSLKRKFRRLIKQVPVDIRVEFQKRWHSSIQAAIAEMKTRGVEVNQVQDISPFVKAVAPVYDQYSNRVSQKLVERIRAENQD